ncbi:MAG: FAD:protein FMN transferase [Pirellulales bacterium]
MSGLLGQDVILVLASAILFGPSARSAEPLVLAGPAMGTTYRVVLAKDLPDHARGEVHREIEAVLARIDLQMSTWREDSDASRFNRAGSLEWVEVGDDLAAIVEIARQTHAETEGAFDITVAPLVQLWAGCRADDSVPTAAEIAVAIDSVGMDLVESRPAGVIAAGLPAALRKLRPGVAIDLGGIGPGFAVDSVGARLVALGSRGHLVELGGEVRAWGSGPSGRPWRVALPHEPGSVIELVPGEAIAFSTVLPGRGPIDPRTGRPAPTPPGTFLARAGSCAVADARAVATAIVAGRVPPPQR